MTAGDTVLVANRGEIAVRLLRAGRELGLRTVAVFSDADRGAPHVRLADDAVRLGPASPTESYLRADAILAAAQATGAGLIHPGYGFLSEDADFAEAVQREGLVFVGPTPEQLRAFGTKHTARAAAKAAGVPLFAGSELLADATAALEAAEQIGYPVMLKPTGGGGGIGMQVCRGASELLAAFGRVVRLAERSFGAAGVFVERFVNGARHVEVQIFGDGAGRVVSLGDRDCSLQRRNQKVIEEAPAPELPDGVRTQLHESSRALAASVSYRSAGTVEFVYDPARGEASFLEVNARLQVEHPVTEAVTGVDLAAWMFRLARGESGFLEGYLEPGAASGQVPVSGHAVEARVYAEDPFRDYRPSTGTITAVSLPGDARVDTWIEDGTEVSAFYDPLLAKVITAGADRDEAFDRLGRALETTVLHGIETNLGTLCAAVDHDDVRAARHSTVTLATIPDPRPRITVERPGLLTTVQDLPGRVGLWHVGVPPSGPMDDLSFRLGNRALGNPDGAAGLECTASGPALRVTHGTTVCLTGADCPVTVNGEPVPMWEPVEVPAGGVIDVGAADTAGLRTYVLFAGGLDVPQYLSSASTFTLGRFGGHGGRQLVTGDVIRTAPAPEDADMRPVPREHRPVLPAEWQLTVTEGPHAAPEFFTRDDIQVLFDTAYRVHFNSARTGVRLVGPKPHWARPDGGDAGLHPSNIHDTPYSVGALDFTGDTPILLGPDGPSLGGFVCPVTVIAADRWKLGQLRPGDTVRFVPVRTSDAPAPADHVAVRRAASPFLVRSGGDRDDGVLARREGNGAPAVTYRRSGDDNVLVEYGDMVLALALRARVHALHTRLEEVRCGTMPGIVDLTPGIRSLQVHVDPQHLPVHRLLGVLNELEDDLPATSELLVPSRAVRLPLSWDDPATREAIARYMSGVRDDAPWCPSNIEFIRRVNGLDSEAAVMDVVFSAEYLTLGLGDVYLGAPVATPLDPRHRLVTTKYNPARTWTAENSVGIGGAYLCIYGMEGPGGYQFVGRTTQVWSTYRHSGAFAPGSPWLLRFFDRISWYPVSPEELLEMRADLAAGRGDVDITEGTFSLADHECFLADNADSIAAFRARQNAAFSAERAAWAAAGEFDRAQRAESRSAATTTDLVLDPGAQRVDAPFSSNVWKVDVEVGERVAAGQPLLALEAMKMETVLTAPADGIVTQVLVEAGNQVDPGTPLVVVGAEDDVTDIPA
ncbi:urea carboxylase [Mycolicibacterium doricum]|uniref:biotin carboxylase n=1 Tax=Mycolicibacterium doricum TaxID=126673 RepID=A0A1X1TG01_9MYCO|nr:urea carboxylase [Mycolicibacterium doricum]MCV7266815.1 urea carboxylase [Mycolicibacterium doricum]ORV43485.1 urea carboxylase [Mycolicibacterium doricum]BBZ07069.1 urea carboxylase [Mycolicibacterium doricum]